MPTATLAERAPGALTTAGRAGYRGPWLRRTGLAVLGLAALAAGLPRPAAAQPAARYVKADAEFLQGMIAHHAQAIEMSVLVAKRTRNGPLNSLAERIIVSQQDEIKLMRRWLLERGAEAPDPLAKAAKPATHGHGSTNHGPVPGMLTAEEMTALAAATGPEFERLYLTGMIKHHEGAITMVAALYQTPGAAQDLEVYTMATGIEADQRAEIARMRALLTP
jgi:uncharacterized protein (DUF305 family)